MGGTVMGGAVTSLGASFMLFICQFQYFAKFGFFMFLTIFLSFLYVFLFFVPLLAIIGPDKDCCAICDLRPKELKKRCGKKKRLRPRLRAQLLTSLRTSLRKRIRKTLRKRLRP